MKRKTVYKTNVIKRDDTDLPLAIGLAYTPADMYRLTENGLPVSSDNFTGQFYDGAHNIDWQPEIDRLRGIDPATIWQQEQTSKKKLRNLHSDAKSTYEHMRNKGITKQNDVAK